MILAPIRVPTAPQKSWDHWRFTKSQNLYVLLTKRFGEKPAHGFGNAAAGNLGLLPHGRHGGVHLRTPRRQRWIVREPASLWRPRHAHHRGARSLLHHQRPAGAARTLAASPRARGSGWRLSGTPPCATCVAASARRAARTELPVLRQPSEILDVREHLQRKVGDFQTHRARAQQHPSATARDPRLRCRCRRRNGAHAPHAIDAPPLRAHAVLYRRKGDQPGGRPADARKAAGSLSGASRNRSDDDEPQLLGKPLAAALVAHDGGWPRLA